VVGLFAVVGCGGQPGAPPVRAGQAALPVSASVAFAPEIQDVSGLWWSPDGGTLAVLDLDGVSFLDTASWLERGRVDVQDAHALAFRGDGRMLLIASGADLTVYDATTLRETRRFADFLAGHQAWSLSCTASLLECAIGGDSGQIVLFDLARGAARWSQPGRYAAIAADGATVVLPGPTGPRVVDAATGTTLRPLETRGLAPSHVAFRRDGALLAVGGTGVDLDTRPHLELWDPASATRVGKLAPSGVFADAVAFTPDGAGVFFTSYATTLFDVSTGDKVRSFESGEEHLLAVSPDGRIATGTWKTARIWETATGKALASIERHSDEVKLLSLSADGTTLVTAGPSAETTFRVWDLARDVVRRIPSPTGGHGSLHGIQLSADGKTLGVIGDGFAIVDTATGTVRARPSSPALSRAGAFAFEEGGDALVVTNDSEVVRVSALDGRELRRCQLEPPAAGTSLGDDVSPRDGSIARLVQSDRMEHSIELFDDRCARVRTFAAPRDATGLGFSAEGTRLVVALSVRGAQLLDLDGKTIGRPLEDSRAVGARDCGIGGWVAAGDLVACGKDAGGGVRLVSVREPGRSAWARSVRDADDAYVVFDSGSVELLGDPRAHLRCRTGPLESSFDGCASRVLAPGSLRKMFAAAP
jgi:WD40 repeat protein